MNKELDLKLRKEVLETLKKYGKYIEELYVDHIGYREFYEDGTSMAFCSKKEWYDVAPYSNNMEREMSMHYALELINLNNKGFNYIIRSPSLIKNKFLQTLSSQDMCNSLLVYKKEKDKIKMYSFIVSKSNKEALNHFFNEKEKFENVINFYNKELSKIFHKEEYRNLKQQLFDKKVSESIFEYLKKPAENTIFTPREKECITLLINGANNKDIAKYLDISVRTAAYHVANIRNKLKVNSRYSITKIINKNI